MNKHTTAKREDTKIVPVLQFQKKNFWTPRQFLKEKEEEKRMDTGIQQKYIQQNQDYL